MLEGFVVLTDEAMVIQTLPKAAGKNLVSTEYKAYYHCTTSKDKPSNSSNL